MTRPPETPASELAYVEDQVRRLREQVIPLAEYDSVIASFVNDGHRLADVLQATLARTPSEQAVAGHCLIWACGSVVNVVEQLRAEGVETRQAAVIANLLSCIGFFLIEAAQSAQDAEADR